MANIGMKLINDAIETNYFLGTKVKPEHIYSGSKKKKHIYRDQNTRKPFFLFLSPFLATLLIWPLNLN